MDEVIALRRWREKPAGVGYRRRVIVSTGLRQLCGTRFFKGLLVLGWLAGVFVAAAGFVFTQTVASGGWLESWAAGLGPRPHAVVSAACSLVLLYPDICIRGLFTGLFWFQSTIGLGLSLLALSALMPRLVARDRASQALTIYLSRPLTTADYLLGKLGIIVGVLLLLWTGPLLAGWLLSMAFAPNADFFLYSLVPLLRALLYNLIALAVVAPIALGVSSLGKSSRSVTAMWIGAWIILGALANFPNVPEPVRAMSFTGDLYEVKKDVLRLDEVLVKAGEALPLVNRDFARNVVQFGEKEAGGHGVAASLGLLGLVGVSLLAFFRRLRPE